MRRAMSMLYTALIQAVLVSLLAITLLQVGSKVMNADDFLERVHAKNDALLVNALFVFDDGTMEITVPTGKSYVTRLQSDRVHVSQDHVKGNAVAGSSARFIPTAEIVSVESSASGTLTTWTATNNMITLDSGAVQVSCPGIPAPRQWKRIQFVGEPQDALLLRDAVSRSAVLDQIDVITEQEAKNSVPDLILSFEYTDAGFLIQHSSEAAFQRFACELATGMSSFFESQQVRQLENTHVNTIAISVPSDIDETERKELQRIISEALKQVFVVKQ